MERRRFLKTGARGGFFVFAFGMGCQAEKDPAQDPEPPPVSSDPCADLSGLAKADLQARKALSYSAESPYDDQICDNCRFWIAPKEGAPCGGCVTLRGPIHPKGYCSYWAPALEG